jgi:hypothetical protein
MGTAIALAAAAAAGVSALFVWFQVTEMKKQTEEQGKQTKLQREIAESSAQPYIWADVQVDSPSAWHFELVIGNSGPTVATNVRVTVEPQFPSSPREDLDEVHAKLASGLASLAPGRTLHWRLGPTTDLLSREGSLAHTIHIECDGPFGSVEPVDYVIDLGDVRESTVERRGNLHEVRQAIDRVAKALPKQ